MQVYNQILIHYQLFPLHLHSLFLYHQNLYPFHSAKRLRLRGYRSYESTQKNALLYSGELSKSDYTTGNCPDRRDVSIQMLPPVSRKPATVTDCPFTELPYPAWHLFTGTHTASNYRDCSGMWFSECQLLCGNLSEDQRHFSKRIPQEIAFLRQILFLCKLKCGMHSFSRHGTIVITSSKTYENAGDDDFSFSINGVCKSILSIAS